MSAWAGRLFSASSREINPNCSRRSLKRAIDALRPRSKRNLHSWPDFSFREYNNPSSETLRSTARKLRVPSLRLTATIVSPVSHGISAGLYQSWPSNYIKDNRLEKICGIGNGMSTLRTFSNVAGFRTDYRPANRKLSQKWLESVHCAKLAKRATQSSFPTTRKVCPLPVRSSAM